MRNGCMSMLLIGLILACLSTLAMAQLGIVREVARTSEPATASSPADNASTADSVAAVGKAMEEMGISASSLDRYAARNQINRNGDRPSAALTGTVLTDDGSELPADARVSVFSGWETYGYMQNNGQVQNGAFSVNVWAGTAWVIVKASGWAPAMAGPISLSTDQAPEDLQIVLSRGISCTLHVTDDQGKPVSGVRVSSQIQNGYSSDSISATSDAGGNALLEHLPSNAFSVQIEAEGWYSLSRKLDVDDGQTVEICLAKRPFITGTVVQAEDGKPIAGAEVFVMDLGQDIRWQMQNDRLLPSARTGNDGFFSAVARVGGDAQVVVGTEDKRIKIIKLIDGKPMDFRMPKPMYVRGHIIGDMSKLSRQDGRTYQFYCYSSTQVQGVESNQLGMNGFSVPVTENEGKYTFEIFPVFPGPLQFNAGQFNKTIQLDKAIEDMEINLDEEPEINGPDNARGMRGDASPAMPRMDDLAMLTMPTMALGAQLTAGDAVSEPEQINSFVLPAASAPANRAVIVKFTPPPGSKAVTGFVRVNINGIGDPMRPLEVKDNQVQFECPPGRNVSLSFQSLPGAMAQDQNFMVSPGTEPLVRTVRLNPAGAVHVKVVDEDGQPVIVQRVELASMNYGQVHQLGFQGNWQPRVSAKAPNEFLVPNMPLGNPMSFYVNEMMGSGVCPPVTLTAAEPVQETTIVLKRGMDYVVHLLDLDGKPMPGQAALIYWGISSQSWTTSSPIRADGHGDLHLDRIDPTAGQGYYLVMSNVPSARPVSLKLTDETELTLQLEQGLHLRGTVIEGTSGRPVLNAPVHAIRQGAMSNIYDGPFLQSSAITNDKGEFEFDNLAPGSFYMEVSNLRSKPRPSFLGFGGGSSSPPTATAGQEAPVKLEVVEYGNGQPFPYVLGDAPATRPAGSATQPAGSTPLPAGGSATQPAGGAATRRASATTQPVKN